MSAFQAALRELVHPTGSRHQWTECRKEEAINCATHALGFVLSLVAFVAVFIATAHGPAARFIGCIIYTASLVMVYGSSCGYHACRAHTLKRRLRTLDHICIYLLIAGTYTPFMLTLMAGPIGYSILAVVWSCAAVGIAVKLMHTGRFDGISTLAYIAMGWAVLPAIGEMIRKVPAGGIVWMLVGGLLYTGGVIFYRLDHKVKYFHAIWHLFVLGGSITQFIAVWRYIVRA